MIIIINVITTIYNLLLLLLFIIMKNCISACLIKAVNLYLNVRIISGPIRVSWIGNAG